MLVNSLQVSFMTKKGKSSHEEVNELLVDIYKQALLENKLWLFNLNKNDWTSNYSIDKIKEDKEYKVYTITLVSWDYSAFWEWTLLLTKEWFKKIEDITKNDVLLIWKDKREIQQAESPMLQVIDNYKNQKYKFSSKEELELITKNWFILKIEKAS